MRKKGANYSGEKLTEPEKWNKHNKRKKRKKIKQTRSLPRVLVRFLRLNEANTFLSVTTTTDCPVNCTSRGDPVFCNTLQG
jgi:hypothetical protein